MLGRFPLTLPAFITIILLIILVVKKRPIEKKLLFSLTAFILFAFISTSLLRGRVDFILSLGMLSCMALPLVFKLKLCDVIGYEKYLIVGFFITIPFSLYDIGVTILGFVPFEKMSNLFLNATNSPVSSYDGYYRVKATFTEPSYFGIYLVTVFYVLLETEIRKKGVLTLLLLINIILTLSLSAFILVGFLLLIYLFRKKIIIYKYSLFICIAIFTVPSISDLVFNRLQETFLSVGQSNYYGSEGVRANSIFLMFEYLGEQKFINLMLGEGYSYYDEWLIDRFAGADQLVGYSRGQIFNAFAVIGISLGVIGLILYSNFFFLLARSKDFNLLEILFHILIQFSLAFMVGYLFWSVLILMKFKNIIKKSK
jgi:hypothetical protein